jgi:O-antigen ligase
MKASLGYLLLFLMVALPGVIPFLYLKGFLFALLVAFVAIRVLGHQAWHPSVLFWTIFVVTVSLLFGLIGLFTGAPGAFDRIKVDALWPLVFLWIIGGIDSPQIFRNLQRTLVVAAAFIALMGFNLALSALGVLPQSPFLESMFSREQLDSGLFYSAAIHDDYVGINVPGVNLLPFLLPFLMAHAAMPAIDGVRWLSRRWVLITLGMSMMLTALSARRGAQLAAILAPLIIYFLALFHPKQERKPLIRVLWRTTAAIVVVIISGVMLLGRSAPLTFGGLAERFSSGFDFSASNTSDSAVGRVEQYYALLDGWRDSPIVGKGLGASAHQSIRSQQMPWAYELFYVDMLFQTGILGFAAYGTAVLWLYWSGIKIIRRGGLAAQFMLPMLAGLSGMMIAGATNPHLGGFETFWVFFVPLAYINYVLLNGDTERAPSRE